MPKIKRWFNVDQDINHKPKIRELIREFGLSGLRIWLEILSIGDRNDGEVDCTSEGAISRLTSASESKKKVTTEVVLWLYKRSSIVLVDHQNHISKIANYAKYHRTEERKPVPPNLPNLPNHIRTPIVPLKGDSGFDQFWKQYPNKTGKGAAEKAWKKIKVGSDIILAALEIHKQSERWVKDNGQYIPNPATWLNQKRWEDELPGANGEDNSQQAWKEKDQAWRAEHGNEDPFKWLSELPSNQVKRGTV